MVTWTKKKFLILGVSLVIETLHWDPLRLQAHEIEVEPAQSSGVGGDTGPSVPSTSHIFDGYADKEHTSNFG